MMGNTKHHARLVFILMGQHTWIVIEILQHFFFWLFCHTETFQKIKQTLWEKKEVYKYKVHLLRGKNIANMALFKKLTAP